jgi:NTE family protein
VKSTRPRTGIVLSGGGARGAYEVGIAQGILEVLENRGVQAQAFDILCGTSVGAINAAYLASHAHHPRMDIEGLIAAWESLRLEEQLRLDVRGLLDIPRAMLRGATDPGETPAILDTRALEATVNAAMDWDKLHENIRSNLVHAVIVAALEIGTGRTTLFVERSPETEYTPTRDPRRVSVDVELELNHIMASAALPLLFPPRRIDNGHYCDGGVRFNTPIAPAIRSGSERLIVVSLQYLDESPPSAEHLTEVKQSFGNPAFLLGKLLDALLLDPTTYDLHILSRLNDLIEQMEITLAPKQLEAFHQAVSRGRGLHYRKLETLVFRPSLDIGLLAHEYAAQIAHRGLASRLLMRFATRGTPWESDLLSFVLFDGGYAGRLIALGRQDVLARADEVYDFYAD